MSCRSVGEAYHEMDFCFQRRQPLQKSSLHSLTYSLSYTLAFFEIVQFLRACNNLNYQVFCQAYLRHISSISQVIFYIISQTYFRQSSGISQAYFRNISDVSKAYLDKSQIIYFKLIPGISQSQLRLISSIISQTHLRRLSDKFHVNFRQISDIYQTL